MSRPGPSGARPSGERPPGERPSGERPPGAGPAEVVLYGRDGCCLCDQAREVLLRVRAAHPFSFEERDIERDEALLHAYLERIPVVTIDGVEVFEFFVDEAELTERLG